MTVVRDDTFTQNFKDLRENILSPFIHLYQFQFFFSLKTWIYPILNNAVLALTGATKDISREKIF